MTRLWRHQRLAVAAASDVLAAGGRATVVAACGTGKTLVGATAAGRLAGRGRILVVVPTLDLLAQTLAVYRDEHGPGRHLVAVCSAAEAVGDRHTVAVTTSPASLAAVLRADEPVTVLCTYASLPVVAAAHADHDLRRWDVVVVDEAHRTAGTIGKPWAQVHHDGQIQAARRLYLTATPRVYLGDDDADLVSMNDPETFGPVVHRLGFGEAIAAGLLADYRVVVPVVTDAEVHRLLRPGAEADPALLAVQVATLRAAAAYDLRRVITYHTRVASARAFAETLTTAWDAVDERGPGRLWARWIAGEQTARLRRELLADFAAGDDQLAVLANARVLREGIDAPATDGVVFADPFGSVIDTVQAVGRALRTGGRTDKVATIVVPVFVGPDEQAEAILDASAYQPLWRTLRALRAHDDRLNDWLLRTRPRSIPDGDGPRSADLSWLRLLGVDEPDDLALAITVRTVGARSVEWRTGYAAARRWHVVHGSLNPPQDYVAPGGFRLGSWVDWQRWLNNRGSLPPARAEALETLGIVWSPRRSQWEQGFAAAAAWAAEHGHLAVPVGEVASGIRLGVWLRNQRSRLDEVPAERRTRLAALDPLWHLPFGLAWHRGLAEARAFRAANGHLDVKRTHVTSSGHRLGEWLHTQRQARDDLTAEQRDLLDAIGMNWQMLSPHEQTWREHLRAATVWHAEYGHLEVPQKHVTGDGIRLGVWINNLRRRAATLSPDRRQALDRLGMRWSGPPVPAPPVPAQRGPAPQVRFQPPAG
ncbi:Helicase associated domain protein [Polymorphospora sp. NPDC050346]|uniref:DEAD/DEAH box helicase n=1 Tax=Polymorphospora sp. NPDC050346 TaxID=3155780 RepID=UPI0034071AEE